MSESVPFSAGCSQSGPSSRLFLPAALSAIAAVWAFGLSGDLWLDEICFTTFASTLRNPAGILTAPSLDGNHPLVTFAAWVIGPRRPEFAYRLVSFVSGVASVGLMSLLAMRYGKRVARISTVLGGGCFFLFCYSVEARGYAPVVFASLLSFLSVASYLEGRGRRGLFLYWLTVPLGLLSHASYAYCLCGILCWSALVLSQRELPAGKELLRVHAIPALLFALYIPWLLTRTNIGGPEHGFGRVLLDVAVYTTGAPDHFPWNAAAGIALLLAVWAGWRCIARERPPDHIFFAVVILLAPAAATLAATAAGKRYFYARYYLATVPFSLVLAAKAIDDMSARFPAFGTRGIVALLALFLAGNGILYTRFLESRRGNYREAVRFMAANTPGSELTIGGRNEWPIQSVLDYYFPGGYAGEKRLVYLESDPGRTAPADWIVLDYGMHMADTLGAGDMVYAPGFVLFPQGFVYRLEKVFPSGGPSGYSWHVYRHIESFSPPTDFPFVALSPVVHP